MDVARTRCSDDRTPRSGEFKPESKHGVQRVDTAATRSLIARALLAAVLLSLPLGCQHFGHSTPQAFATPEAAADALFEALESDDADALLAVLGTEFKQALVTSDWDSEFATRSTIAKAGRAQHDFLDIGDGTLELIIGEKQWPFPMPLLQDGKEWRFGTEAGIQELIDRRIGKNELTVIEIMQAYVDAQIEYATRDRNGDGMLEYAQRLGSTPGTQDGLYWEAAPDEDQSPLGPLMARAERYMSTVEAGDPIRGYYFQILKSQGPSAPGGARSYLIDGRMQTGFGLLAYPADYGNTGIMTFVVNYRGDVYQKDLGGKHDVENYDPDESWTLIDD